MVRRGASNSGRTAINGDVVLCIKLILYERFVYLSPRAPGCRRKHVRMEVVRGRSKDDRGGDRAGSSVSYTAVRNQ